MKALIVEHADHEGPGLVGDALEARGFAVDRRRLHRGDPLPDDGHGFDVVVAMGGPQDAWDDAGHPYLAREAALYASLARRGQPLLAVCLGAQLLARGLGARVFRGPRPELGLAPIALTDEGRADEQLRPFDGRDVLHWHSDTFELPPQAIRLAESPLYTNQAYRVGRALAVQFHVECGLEMRRDWATRGADELRAAGVEPSSLFSPSTTALDERGRAFAAGWVERLR